MYEIFNEENSQGDVQGGASAMYTNGKFFLPSDTHSERVDFKVLIPSIFQILSPDLLPASCTP